MQSLNNNTQAFLELVRAGLWEKEARLSQFKDIDFSRILSYAEEQSVVGLVAAGLEHVKDVKIPQEYALKFVGQALQIEQRNLLMNSFIGDIYGKMQKIGLYGILVKGQGIAQCYERPLWRTSGDIDLLFNDDSYDRAKEWFCYLGQINEEENDYRKRINFHIDEWEVELHGTMRGELGVKIDKWIDVAQRNVFYGGEVRSWNNGKVTVFLPSSDNDIIFIFTHILQHFFRGGIGLRQICDWSRLMWTYRDEIDWRMLEKQIRKMGVLSEWKAFGALAVENLGLPIEANHLYSTDKVWKRKTARIIDYVLEVGNFGHNRDRSYFFKHGVTIRKIISFLRLFKEGSTLFLIFPLDTLKTISSIFVRGTVQYLKGNR